MKPTVHVRELEEIPAPAREFRAAWVATVTSVAVSAVDSTGNEGTRTLIELGY